jgi:hypothetical protein
MTIKPQIPLPAADSRMRLNVSHGLSVAIMLALLLTLFGCGSRHLDRDQAKQMILERMKSSPAITAEVCTGKQSSVTLRGDSALVKALVNKGMMSYNYLGEEIWNIYRVQVYDIELTAEGLKYKVGKTGNPSSYADGPYNSQVACHYMRMADLVFVAITGIRESQGGESAQVDFTWKYANITPFGEVGPLLYPNRDYSTDKVHQGSVTVTKFDDGWRLPNPWSLPVQ